jgi:ribosome-associated translation inhibitor RaiA
MQIITIFRDMPPSPSLQAAAERWVGRLEQVYDRIVGCHVAIERPQRHPLQGAPFQVRIVLAVPGANLAVSHQTSKDAYVAIADAFRAARRQLLDHVARQRGFVEPPVRRAGFAAGTVTGTGKP